MTEIVSTGYVASTSTGRFFFYPVGDVMGAMQTVQETRRQRLGMIKARFGRWVDVNAALGWDSTNARLSQIHSGTIRSDRGTPYTMGDDTAREIETKLELPSGWMDTPPTYAELDGHFDRRARAEAMLAAMDGDQIDTAIRLLDALTQREPKNGTTGH